MEKLHWHNLAFMWQEGNAVSYQTVFQGNDGIEMTIPFIKAAKKSGNVPNRAFLLSTSYLGHMTQEQFNPEEK